jgi:hypothetical protein
MKLLLFIFMILLYNNRLSTSSNPLIHSLNKNTNENRNNQQNVAPINSWQMRAYKNGTYTDKVELPDEQNLINRLLRNYDAAARPVFNASNPVRISFGMALIQLCDMDERNQVMTINVWLEQVNTSTVFYFY